MIQLGYIVLSLCNKKHEDPCRLRVEEILNVLEKLCREQRYVVYSSPRNVFVDLKLLAHFLGKDGATHVAYDGKILVIDREDLEKLGKVIEENKGLISEDFLERLSLVL